MKLKKRQAATKAIAQCGIAHSSNGGYFHERHDRSIELHPKAILSIQGLFFGRRPSAVGLAVVSVVINAVNRVVRTWMRTHVSIEIFKRLPFDANSTPSVGVVASVSRVGASRNHSHPCDIFRRFRHAVRGVGATGRRGRFALDTSTAFSSAALALKMTHVGHTIRAAIAQAFPSRLTRLRVFSSLHNDEPSESLIEQILHVHTQPLYAGFAAVKR